MMREEEFKQICEELGGIYIKTREGSIKCIFTKTNPRDYSVL
jgi:hypothetical protein